MKKMMNEFKQFISRGNVIDLAVGVVIGSAFGKIVTSLVSDILMPIMGILLGGVDFTGLSIKFDDAIIKYGNFIQNIIDFLIVSFCIFILIKFVNKISNITKKEKKEEKVKSDEVLLLEQIRDLLKNEK